MQTYYPSDYSLISFPGIGLEVDPPREIPLFGDVSIRLYGIIIAIGMLLAVIYALRRSKQFGLTQDHLLDGVLWIAPFAILCARLYYCAFEWEQYAPDPISVLYIWKGGLAIYGGVIGAILGVIVYCLVRKISIGAVLDILMLGFLIGQAVGRWGNFCNREAFGAEVDPNFFLAMGLFNTKTQAYQYFHPTFLYESLWNVAGFIGLHFLSKKRQYDGQIALGYAVWYGLGRAWIEGLRVDSLWWGPFRVSQVLAALTCLAGTIVLLAMTLRKPDRQKLFVNKVAALAAAKEAAEETTEESGEDTDEAAEESCEDTDCQEND